MPRDNTSKIISLIFAARQRIFKKILGAKRPPFSLIQLLTIQFVLAQKQPLMKEIADFLNITPPSATSLIDGLVANGILKRYPDKTDRRIVRLRIRPKGKQIMTKGFKEISAHIEKMLSRLNENDQNAFIKILEKLSKTKN